LNTIADAVEIILRAQEATQKPLGVILAGHNRFRVASKIDLITNLQAAGYFVLLAFVGLRGRLDQSRGDAGAGGWARRPGRDPAAAVSQDANGDCRGAEGCASILTDNRRTPAEAFTVCRVQLGADAAVRYSPR
jgi:hypothetical protein